MFDSFYPNGGMNDFEESFDSWEEIDSYFEEHELKEFREHCQVFDTAERKEFNYPSREMVSHM